MDDEPKSPAEMKEIRLKRKRDQEVEGDLARRDADPADARRRGTKVAVRKRGKLR